MQTPGFDDPPHEAARTRIDGAGDVLPQDVHRSFAALQARIETASPAGRPARPGAASPTTLASSGVPRRRSWGRIALAMGAAMVVAVVAGRMLDIPASSPPATYRVHTTGRGERAIIQLADGSHIMLGVASKIRYAYPFGAHDRNILIEGEAYFTVAPNTAMPFVVLTEKAAAQVLGTTFAVRAYPGDSLAHIAVVSGKVAVRSREAPFGSGMALIRGQSATIDNAGLATVEPNAELNPYISWTEGKLTFSSATLREVIRTMERWYDVRIILADSTLADARVTALFDSESLEQAVTMLSKSLDLDVHRTGNTMTFSPRKR